MNSTRRSNIIKYSIMAAKYLFPIILSVICMFNLHTKRYATVILIEVFVISIVSNMLLRKKYIAGYLFSSIFMLLVNAQCIVLFFGNNYIELVMLSNLNFLGDLSGKVLEYGAGVLLVLLFSFFPVKEVEITKNRDYKALSIILVVELAITMIYGSGYSPLYAYIDLLSQKVENDKRSESIEQSEDKTNLFYKESIGDFVSKPEELEEKPNVILLFTEGISQNVIDDPRDITPNFKQLQEESITFRGYYNHSFATLRGLQGQLYSGYQMNNLDNNSLISIEDILNDNDYYTGFLNTEPNNKDFVIYLKNLGFDEVFGECDEYLGMQNSMSDKQAYEKLTDTVKMRHDEGKPYFLVMYTFGTHASFQSMDEDYKDGSNNFLNKFYNVDYQFGEFFKEFQESELSDNTILVMTGDHCTYGDSDFAEAFPEYSRDTSMVDEMPLYIWYKGVQPNEIQVHGRNSLDLAPTILDIMDIDGENYFLGTSLYDSKTSNLETIYECEGSYIDTNGGNIRILSDEEKIKYVEIVNDYFAAKKQTPIEME